MICRAGIAQDVDGIRGIELRPEFRTFVSSWSEEQHLRTLADPDAQYFVCVDDSGLVGGFAILRGICSENKSLEIARIAVAQPNLGLGRTLLWKVIGSAFNKHDAHRLWLDVFEGNARAQHLYQSCGFKMEGLLREAILRDGKFYSLFLMSMLENEYRLLLPRMHPRAVNEVLGPLGCQ
jgi:diamine N-acetyltransferase